jgi:hypothetical protein
VEKTLRLSQALDFFASLWSAQNHVKEGDPGRRPLSDILCAGKYRSLRLDDADRNLRRSRSFDRQREIALSEGRVA